MGYNDTWNSRQLATYLSRCRLDDVWGDGWYGVGKLKATYVDYSYNRIKVIAEIEITDDEEASNSQISGTISEFINDMIDEYGISHSDALRETPPRIDLVIKKR